MLIKIKALQLLHSIPSRDLLLHSKDNPSLRYEALCKQASSLLQPHWFSAVLWLSCFSPDLRFTAPPSYIYLNTTSLACLSTSCFLSHVQLFVTQWTAVLQASPSLLKFMSIESMMLTNHLILCHPLLFPSVFPSIRVFSNELTLSSSGQSIGPSASALVLPMTIKG